MRDLVEARFDIPFENPLRRVFLDQDLETLLHCVMGGSLWPDSVGVLVCKDIGLWF